MEIWILWLIIMGILLLVEVLTQMMWTLCLAVGCLGAVVACLCGAGLLWQVIVMTLASFAAYVLLVPLFQKWHALKVDAMGKASRTGMDALLGRHAFLNEEIRPDRLGRGRIDGDHWQMRADEKYGRIPSGTEVVVIGYDSIILDVEPVNRPSNHSD